MRTPNLDELIKDRQQLRSSNTNKDLAKIEKRALKALTKIGKHGTKELVDLIIDYEYVRMDFYKTYEALITNELAIMTTALFETRDLHKARELIYDKMVGKELTNLIQPNLHPDLSEEEATKRVLELCPEKDYQTVLHEYIGNRLSYETSFEDSVNKKYWDASAKLLSQQNIKVTGFATEHEKQ